MTHPDLSPAIPSPPQGVPVHRQSWLATVTPEETDLAGRITVAATAASYLPTILAAVLGNSSLAGELFHIWSWLDWPLTAAVLAGGFMSRSRTARALATITTAGFAGLFLADRLGISATLFTAGSWIYRAAIASAVGLWAIRALRRRFIDDTE